MNREARPANRLALWNKLCRLTAFIYTLMVRSRLGRAMTAYRSFDHASLDGRYGAGRRIRPASRARLFLSESAKDGLVFAALRAPFRVLYLCPLKFYGMFGLSFAVLCMLSYVLLPLLFDTLDITGTHWNVAVVMLALSLPLLSSPTTLAEGVCGSRLCRHVLVNYLSLPLDYIPHAELRGQAALPYASIILSIGAVVATLLVNPLAVPIFGFMMILLGLVFTYPEAGVLLITLCLPILWLFEGALPYFLCLLVLTWASFGVKLFLMHRTLRFGFLDRMVLLFGAVVLLSGFVGPRVSSTGMTSAVTLFACISLYFLMVNLMNTRAYIGRCFIGFGISVAILVVLLFLRVVSPEAMDWLAGSRAGDALRSLWLSLRRGIGPVWNEQVILLLVMSMPFLLVCLTRARRLLSRVATVTLLVAVLWLMMHNGSPWALVAVVCAGLVFLLMLGYRAAATGLIVLPPVLCGMAWLTVYLDNVWAGMGDALSLARVIREARWESLWQLVRDNPTGVGMGVVPDSGTLALELLHSFGWQGLLVSLGLLFFVLQKGTTALVHAPVARDRVVILAGVSSAVGGLVFSSSGGAWLSPALVLSVIIILSLGSTYADVLFDESDILTAEAMVTPFGEDRIFRGR